MLRFKCARVLREATLRPARIHAESVEQTHTIALTSEETLPAVVLPSVMQLPCKRCHQ